MNAEKTWKPTNIQGVYRHKSGRLYSRVYCQGSDKWVALKTQVLEVAKARHLEIAVNYGLQAKTQAAAAEGRMTMGDCIRIYEEKVKAGFSLHGKGRQSRRRVAERTIQFRLELLRALLRSWPELPKLDVRKITPQDCERWADTYCQKQTRKDRTISANRFNNSVDTMRHLFEIAIKTSARHGNPASELGKLPVRPKMLTLPSRVQFLSFISVIRSGGGRFSRKCADYIEFLAYTGARKKEAAHVCWQDVDFDKGTILLSVTKNGRSRYVPMIAEARQLLERLKKQFCNRCPQAPVLQVREAQQAMDRASKRIAMKRITHHDLRHLFATVCIESGVDIPTVSRWLGHLDGGVLAMRTYGHLRDEHSRNSANKVHFGGLPEPARLVRDDPVPTLVS